MLDWCRIKNSFSPSTSGLLCICNKINLFQFNVELQYSTIKNDYELTMRDSTEIIQCTEDTSDVPSITFNFCKIADLNASLKDSVVDILGICKSATDVQTITSQKLNKVIMLRHVHWRNIVIGHSRTTVSLNKKGRVTWVEIGVCICLRLYRYYVRASMC